MLPAIPDDFASVEDVDASISYAFTITTADGIDTVIIKSIKTVKAGIGNLRFGATLVVAIPFPFIAVGRSMVHKLENYIDGLICT